MSVLPLVDDDLVTRSVSVARREVVFFKAVFEASEGVAVVFAERGGDLVVAAPCSRETELDELLQDLAAELGAAVEPRPAGA